MNFREWFDFSEESIVGPEIAKKLRYALKQSGMSRKKRDHSERVAKGVHSLFIPTKKAEKMTRKGVIPQLDQHQWTTVISAIFHDYLEHGGDHSVLYKLGLSPEMIKIINALTNDDEEDSLEHLQNILPTLDDNTKNMVVLIKLSDRIDNLDKRVNADDRNYMTKSNQLVNWLFQVYTGNPEYIGILRKRLRNLGVKINKSSKVA